MSEYTVKITNTDNTTTTYKVMAKSILSAENIAIDNHKGNIASIEASGKLA